MDQNWFYVYTLYTVFCYWVKTLLIPIGVMLRVYVLLTDNLLMLSMRLTPVVCVYQGP